MRSLDQLRLGVALAFSVPRVVLELDVCGDATLQVGSTSTADVSPCVIRQVLLASAVPQQPDHTRMVRAVRVRGALSNWGAGTYAHDTIPGRWLPTFLKPEVAASVAGDACPGLDVEVRADMALAVSVVRLTSSNSACLDAGSLALAASLMVEEIVASTELSWHHQ